MRLRVRPSACCRMASMSLRARAGSRKAPKSMSLMRCRPRWRARPLRRRGPCSLLEPGPRRPDLQEATVARSLVHRLPQLRRRLGYLDGTQAHAQYRRGYRQRGHFAIPREGTENAIAKARVRGDVNHMEPMLARDVSKCVKEHGLTHATDPGNAKQSVRSAGAVFKRFGKVVENLVSTDKFRWIHSSRRLERINAHYRTSPSAVKEV